MSDTSNDSEFMKQQLELAKMYHTGDITNCNVSTFDTQDLEEVTTSTFENKEVKKSCCCLC